MKKILTAVLLGLSADLYAQQAGNLNTGGCGTVTSAAQLQQIYDFVQHNPAAYHKGTAVVDTIPLSIHIVGNDAGSGYYPVETMLHLICQLNQKYAPVNFFFYIKWPLQYINNTAYYVQDYNSGEAMMNANNIANSVNVYFVQDPAGNCGYYTYYGDAVSIGKNCAGSNSTTLAHELGHFFSLPHTFSGWENGNTPSNPERVRRTGVGSNCNNAGDGFCDTDADFISTRWSCPNTVPKQDVNGDSYHVDSSLYMSYSLDACQSRFSDQQVATIQYNLHNAGNRTGINAAIPPHLQSIGATPHIIYPVDTQYSNLTKIVWNKTVGAEYYYVSISVLNGIKKQTAFVTDTSVALSFAPYDGVNYVVSISPVNALDVCTSHTTTKNYIFTNNANHTLTVPGIQGESPLNIYPNPAGRNQQLNFQLSNMAAGVYKLSIMDINGHAIYQESFPTTGNETKALQLPEMASGLYFVRLSNGTSQVIQKLVINP